MPQLGHLGRKMITKLLLVQTLGTPLHGGISKDWFPSLVSIPSMTIAHPGMVYLRDWSHLSLFIIIHS